MIEADKLQVIVKKLKDAEVERKNLKNEHAWALVNNFLNYFFVKLIFIVWNCCFNIGNLKIVSFWIIVIIIVILPLCRYYNAGFRNYFIQVFWTFYF